jgi:iron complex transport system permease protein
MPKSIISYLLLLLALCGLVFLNLMQGEVSIGWQALWQNLSHPELNNNLIHAVIWQLRLPRVCIILLIGMGLGAAGVALQSLLRNPLADPSLLGISSGAGLAILLSLILLPLPEAIWLTGSAALGSLLAVIALLLLGQMLHAERIAGLLLAGVALNALMGAGISALLYFASAKQLQLAIYWSLGGISNLSWTLVLVAGLGLLIGMLLLLQQARALDVWRLGDVEARSLGLSCTKLRLLCILGVACIVGAAVTIAGPIAFLGLVVPHIARFSFGALHRRLFPAAMLWGAVLLLLADWLSRQLLSPGILPLGITMALLGSPLFLILLYRYRAGL